MLITATKMANMITALTGPSVTKTTMVATAPAMVAPNSGINEQTKVNAVMASQRFEPRIRAPSPAPTPSMPATMTAARTYELSEVQPPRAAGSMVTKA